MTDTTKPHLVEHAFASGREVHVTTYRDGNTKIQATLLFHSQEDANECARVLREARKP